MAAIHETTRIQRHRQTLGRFDRLAHSDDLHLEVKHLKPKSTHSQFGTHAAQQMTFVTGEVVHVDGGAHAGKW